MAVQGVLQHLGELPQTPEAAALLLSDVARVAAILDGGAESTRRSRLSALTSFGRFLAGFGQSVPSFHRRSSVPALPPSGVLADFTRWLQQQSPSTASTYRYCVSGILRDLHVDPAAPGGSLDSRLFVDVVKVIPPSSVRMSAWNAFSTFLRISFDIVVPTVHSRDHVARNPPEGISAAPTVDVKTAGAVAVLIEALAAREPPLSLAILHGLSWDRCVPRRDPRYGSVEFRLPGQSAEVLVFPPTCRAALVALWDASGGHGPLVGALTLPDLLWTQGEARKGVLPVPDVGPIPLPPPPPPLLPVPRGLKDDDFDLA